MYLAWRPFRWRRRSRRGRGKGLPLKVSEHIYCEGILYYTLYFNPETIRGMTVPPQSKKEGPKDDQVMSWFLKSVPGLLCVSLHVFGVEALSLKTTKQKGRGKGLPLKVAQHMYCDGILYYTLYFNPMRQWEEWQFHSVKGVAKRWSGYELVLKKCLCLLCVSLHVFGVEALLLKTTKQKGREQRTSFKGWSTHILYDRHSLLYVIF